MARFLQPESEEAIDAGFSALDAGRPDEALACVEGLDGQVFPRASLLRGHAYKALGQHLEAEVAYRELAKSDDRNHQSTGWWSLASLKTTQFSVADAAQLDRLIEGAQADGFLGLLHLTRAEIWHQAGLPEMAFPHLKAGNDLIAEAKLFHDAAYHRLATDLCSVSAWPVSEAAQADLTPIFIVGQPRSGTTLVEHILAAHPAVDATDELTFFGHRGADLERNGGYAKGLATGSEDLWQELQQRFLKLIEPYRGKQGSHFIDKTPENFLHIGLILKVFPNARIVHVIRDPLDNIVSQYRHFFPEGREYSNTLEGLIFYWKGYLTLMQHWSAQFPERIHHLHYPRLVNTPEVAIAQLLAFCGLEHAEACFSPHETKRPVMTPSAAQVRQPINKAGLGSGIEYAGAMKPWLAEIGRLKEVSEQLFGAA